MIPGVFEFEAGAVREPLSEQQTVQEEAKKWADDNGKRIDMSISLILKREN